MTTNSRINALLGKMTPPPKSTGSSKYFHFWNAEVGSTSTVRFLADPDETNPTLFFIEKHTHEVTIDGKKYWIPCLRKHGDGNCPFCQASAQAYDDGNEERGKALYRKKAYISQILVLESPLEHSTGIQIMEFGPAIMKCIEADLRSGDLEEIPSDAKKGYNFRINKTKAGANSSYTTSKFAPKQTALTKEQLEAVKDIQPLSSLLPPLKSIEEVQTMLSRYLG